MSTRKRIKVARLGVETEDGRMIETDGLSFELVVPLYGPGQYNPFGYASKPQVDDEGWLTYEFDSDEYNDFDFSVNIRVVHSEWVNDVHVISSGTVVSLYHIPGGFPWNKNTR